MLANTTFQLGRCGITRGAQELLEERGMPGLVTTLLDRHAGGDFGDLCEEDRAANAAALRIGGRLLSVYEVARGREPVVVHHHRGGSVADDDPAAGAVLMGTRRLLEMLVGIADVVPGLIAATAVILCEPDATLHSRYEDRAPRTRLAVDSSRHCGTLRQH